MRLMKCIPLCALQSRPLEWWRQKPPHPLPQDVAAAARFVGGDSGGQQGGGGSLSSDEGVPWTSFNDSAMAQVFSHDVAWMMEREVQSSCCLTLLHSNLTLY